MKIYFQNRASKLQNETHSCNRCPFLRNDPCPWNTLVIVDCYGKGHWVDGELLDIFKV